MEKRILKAMLMLKQKYFNKYEFVYEFRYKQLVASHLFLNLVPGKNLAYRLANAHRFQDLVIRIDDGCEGEGYYLCKVIHKMEFGKARRRDVSTKHLFKNHGKFSLSMNFKSFCIILNKDMNENIPANKSIAYSKLRELCIMTNIGLSSQTCALFFEEINPISDVWGAMMSNGKSRRYKINHEKLFAFKPEFKEVLKNIHLKIEEKNNHNPITKYFEDAINAFFDLLTFNLNQPDLFDMPLIIETSIRLHFPIFNNDPHNHPLKYEVGKLLGLALDSFFGLGSPKTLGHSTSTFKKFLNVTWASYNDISEFFSLSRLKENFRSERLDCFFYDTNTLRTAHDKIAFVQDLPDKELNKWLDNSINRLAIRNTLQNAPDGPMKIINYVLEGQRSKCTFSTSLALYYCLKNAHLNHRSLFVLLDDEHELNAIFSVLDKIEWRHCCSGTGLFYLVLELTETNQNIESPLIEKMVKLFSHTPRKLQLIVISPEKLKFPQRITVEYCESFVLSWNILSQQARELLFQQPIALLHDDPNSSLRKLGFDLKTIGSWIDPLCVEELVLMSTFGKVGGKPVRSLIDVSLTPIFGPHLIAPNLFFYEADKVVTADGLLKSGSLSIRTISGKISPLELKDVENVDKIWLLREMKKPFFLREAEKEDNCPSDLLLYLDLKYLLYSQLVHNWGKLIKSLDEALKFIFNLQPKRKSLWMRASNLRQHYATPYSFIGEATSSCILRALLSTECLARRVILFIDGFDNRLPMEGRECLINLLNQFMQRLGSPNFTILVARAYSNAVQQLSIVEKSRSQIK